MSGRIYYRSTFNVHKSKLYEFEQAAYFMALLKIENALRDDCLAFSLARSHHKDVYLQPYWMIRVHNTFKPVDSEYVAELYNC